MRKVWETASGKVLVDMTEEEWRLLSPGGSSQESLDMKGSSLPLTLDI